MKGCLWLLHHYCFLIALGNELRDEVVRHALHIAHDRLYIMPINDMFMKEFQMKFRGKFSHLFFRANVFKWVYFSVICMIGYLPMQYSTPLAL